MTGIIKSISPGLAPPVIGDGPGGITPPKPFSNPIALLDTIVAGTTHVDNIDEIVEGLPAGTHLTLRRDPKNEHDFAAIRILDAQKRRVGFIPADDNEVISRLMDGGKHLYVEVMEKELRGNWHRIEIRVFLDD